MKIKMGDMVVRKGEGASLLFQVTGFDGKFAVLKGVRIPIITFCNTDKLIKLNRKREALPSLHLIK
ncbi:MAG: hypothetical protein ACOCQN_04365 [Halanaerobiaceae bacterium]